MSAIVGMLWKDESGQGMVEYTFVVAFVALAVLSAITVMGSELRTFLNDFSTKLSEINR